MAKRSRRVWLVVLLPALAGPACRAPVPGASAPQSFGPRVEATSRRASSPARLLASAPGAEPSVVFTRESAPPDGPHHLTVGTATLRVRLDAREFEDGAAPLLAWIERCARAVARYYGSFPVPEVDILVHPAPGGAIRGGRTLPRPTPTIAINVGRRAGSRAFERNWSMTHEMVHLALPNLARRHHWLEEGLASYVEPLARARVGWISEADVWREWLDNMATGLPDAGDRGLDHTPTWARTYWGGALFCLLADVEIRKQTGNRHELADALRAIIASGGTIARSWPIERTLRIGDAATGTHVLEELYHAHRERPVAVDLDALWRELGVRLEGGQIRYDDTAPLAGIRGSFVLGPRSVGGASQRGAAGASQRGAAGASQRGAAGASQRGAAGASQRGAAGASQRGAAGASGSTVTISPASSSGAMWL